MQIERYSMSIKKSVKPPKEKTVTVGGEALMEGIMMRGPKGAAMSVRLANGSIETTLKQAKLPSERFKPLGWPLIRGPVSLIYSMVFGYKCMMESAEKATAGIMEEGGEEELSKLDKWLEEHFGPKLMAAIGFVGMVLGIAIAFGLFVWAPERLFDLIKKLSGADLVRFTALIPGAMRALLFIGYMFVMSLLKDIRRVFQYHGAEHKSIFCYEAGLPLTVENVKAQKRQHPRCGTSFLFVMILMGILLSSILYAVWPGLAALRWLRVAIRVAQFPLLMAFGYEFIRFAGKHLNNPVMKILSAPGLAMQCITTKEPDDDIIEVGIEALKAAVGLPYEPLIPAKKEESPDDDNPPSDADRPEPAVECLEP